MELSKVSVKHFRGISKKEIFFGKATTLHGENGVGKTTILSAITWTLFDKFLDGKTGSPKPLDHNGQVISGNVNVQLIFDDDGRPLKLERSYIEQWTQKRGLEKSRLTGHTNDYFVNDEPWNATEYKHFIKEKFGDDELFFILSVPHFFSDQLHWEKRRKYLMLLMEKPTLEDIFAQDEELRKLPQCFLDRFGSEETPEGQNKVIEKERLRLSKLQQEIDKELKELPVRIDQEQKGIEPLTPKQLKDAQNEIQRLEKELEGILSGTTGDWSENERLAMNKAKAELESLIEKRVKLIQEHKDNLTKQIRVAEGGLNGIKQDIKGERTQLDYNEKIVKNSQEELEKSRAEYNELIDSCLSYTPDKVCPTCGQDLPKGKIDEATQNYISKQKAQAEKTRERGKLYKQQIEEREGYIKKNKARIEELNNLLEKTSEDIDAYNDLLTQDPEGLDKIDKDIAKLTKDIEAQEKKLDTGDSDAKRREQIEFIKEELKTHQRVLSTAEHNDSKKIKIDAMIKEVERYQAQDEELKRLTFLVELFTRKRVELYESSLNDNFNFARFQMFELQLNGGIKEVCNVIYDGKTDLSTGERIIVDVDIADTFAKYFGKDYPILIDNINNLTLPLKTHRQVIKTEVDPSVNFLSVRDNGKS